MELQIVGAKKPLSVSDTVFGREYSEGLVHQVVVAYRNAGRSGTKAQKSRSDMSGTTKKFKKQKGGGARHGDYRAPIFVGGGRAFAARPRSFAQKVNKKMYRGAIQTILSELNRQGRLKVVEAFAVDSSAGDDVRFGRGDGHGNAPLTMSIAVLRDRGWAIWSDRDVSRGSWRAAAWSP